MVPMFCTIVLIWLYKLCKVFQYNSIIHKTLKTCNLLCSAPEDITLATRMATSTGIIGHIQEFQLENELLSSYLERVQLFFIANDVVEEKKVAVFLSVIGSKTYSLLRNLLAPNLQQNQAYAALMETLKKHFEPKPVVIAERFHFHSRNQAIGETISTYLAELRRLSTHCAFADYLEQALRDRLVCGIRGESIQKRLLAEADLTLKKAVELAQEMEAAERNAKSLKGIDSAVQKVSIATDRPLVPCYRCGKTSHDQKDCRFREAECHSCVKRGHRATVCRSAKKASAKKPQLPIRRTHNPGKGGRPQRLNTKWVTAEADKDSGEEYLQLHAVGNTSTSPIQIPLLVNNQLLCMELDTGAAISILSEETFKDLFPSAPLRRSTVLLKMYTGEKLPVLGEMDIRVQYEQQQPQDLVLTVVKGDGPSLFGRNWLERIKLNWREIKAISTHSTGSLEYLLDKYGDIFKSELGTIKSFAAKLEVRPGEQPKFCKSRTVPFAVRGAIEDELDRLEREGVLEKVTHSEWATPIVAVPKADGRFRICGDFKVTVNPALNVDQYPLPRADDLFATLAGGKKFTKLDLSQAYLQLELESESMKYCTVNTHLGLFQYTRLPFGIGSAPAVFQRVMDTILQGVPRALCYIDDILVTGASDEEHLTNLEAVFSRLQSHGIRMKKSKCFFMQDSVEYLGHRVDADGLQASPKKVEAIDKAPQPRSVQQLRSYL